MKESDVKEWVKALRSGKYAQAQDYLCEVDETDGTTAYCCLGVACDLFVNNYWIQSRIDVQYTHDGEVIYCSDWSIGEFKKSKNVDTTVFPAPEMMESMGLDFTYAKRLANLNDGGWSFKKIADKIERDLLGEDE